MESPKLWTKNFTIITLGTVVSMLGNALSGFAISVMVLDYTGSTFLYVLFMVVYNIPKVIMPLVAGPFLDRFSRSRTIYTLDFISAACFLLIWGLLRFNFFNYGVFLIFSAFIGTIDGVYTVAYDSLYPTLVSEGNFRKAYSISSLLYPLSAMMVPVSAYVYNNIGLAPLFIFNAVTFLVAAIAETFIDAPETHISNRSTRETLHNLGHDFRDGIGYIAREKGLLTITIYFCLTMFLGSCNSLILPYFKGTPGLNVQLYTFVSGCNVLGRFVGGLIHYRFKYPTAKKFAIALTVYITLSFMEGLTLYCPVWLMMVLMFLSGLFAVTSYNIRISATQSYVPNEMRGRFNGAFQMLCTLGMILGQLAAGGLAEFMSERTVVLAFYGLNLLLIFAVMVPGREHVKLIYNQDV